MKSSAKTTKTATKTKRTAKDKPIDLRPAVVVDNASHPLRPWPSRELANKALLMCAHVYARATGEERGIVEAHRVGTMVEVRVTDGPAVTCTAFGWEHAVKQGKRLEAREEVTAADADTLLAEAVPWHVPASVVAGMLGKIVFDPERDESGKAWLVEHEGCLYAVDNVPGVLGGVRVRLVGRMFQGIPLPKMTTEEEDTGELIPAYDHAEGIAARERMRETFRRESA